MNRAKELVGPTKCARVEVWIAAGKYHPLRSDLRGATFDLLDGVELYGGFSGSETARNQRDPTKHESVLTGDLLGDDTPGGGSAENAYHVLTSRKTSAAAILDGVVVEAGRADGVFPADGGAGILLVDSKARFINVTFRSNSATQDGGDIYVDHGSPTFIGLNLVGGQAKRGGGIFNNAGSILLQDATISRCGSLAGGGIYSERGDLQIVNTLMKENEAFAYALDGGNAVDGRGGALLVIGGKLEVRNTRFESNTITYGPAGGFGGAVYLANGKSRFVDSTFLMNYVLVPGQTYGGAVHIATGSNAYFLRTQFTSNRVRRNSGGAISNDDSTLTVVNSEFSQNGAANMGAARVLDSYGGGIYGSSGTGTLVNVSFVGNFVETNGAGVYWASGRLAVTNATFLGNQASTCFPPSSPQCGPVTAGSAIYGPEATLVNGVVWANNPKEAVSIASVEYSCVEGGGYDETNPTETNRDDCEGNTSPGSTAVDRGSTSALPPDVDDLDQDGNLTEPISLDVDRNPRIVGSAVDMGSHEQQ